MVMPRATDNKQSRRPTTHQFEVDAKKAQKKKRWQATSGKYRIETCRWVDQVADFARAWRPEQLTV